MKHLILVFTSLVLINSCKDDSDQISRPPSCGSANFTDASGNSYSAISIGSTCWLIPNLKTTKFVNGDSIPDIVSEPSWSSTTSPAYCVYDNDTSLGLVYGNLYNYYAVADPRGLCPVGTHVANDSDWAALGAFAGGLYSAGANLKESGNAHWTNPNTAGNNSYNFSALPGGMRLYSGPFSSITLLGRWWTQTDSTNQLAFDYYINNDNAGLFRDYDSKTSGFSVRCVVD